MAAVVAGEGKGAGVAAASTRNARASEEAPGAYGPGLPSHPRAVASRAVASRAVASRAVASRAVASRAVASRAVASQWSDIMKVFSVEKELFGYDQF